MKVTLTLITECVYTRVVTLSDEDVQLLNGDFEQPFVDKYFQPADRLLKEEVTCMVTVEGGDDLNAAIAKISR